MEPNTMQNMPAGAVLVAGLVQIVLIVWIFIFPVLILKKLGEIAGILKNDKMNQ